MNKSELDRYRSQGASALVDAYERLVSERDAIAAHVDRLCEKITEYHSEDIAAEDALNDLAVIVADIPNQSLSERDAEVARWAYVEGAINFGGIGQAILVEQAAEKYAKRLSLQRKSFEYSAKYANQLRAEAKDGES